MHNKVEMSIFFSVDLEPNKDGSFHGIRDAMEWFDRTVPCGTIFTTYEIATEMSDLLIELAESHEIGVHVHPREFGYNHDQLAELSHNQQRKLIEQTREAITNIVGTEPISFRAGRHSVNQETFAVLKQLGFEVDASINVQYRDYLPDSLVSRQKLFILESELHELPTSYARPPILSRVGIRQFPNRHLTATADTLRTDRRGCSGLYAVSWLRDTASDLSMYMHPYDATNYHTNLENNGCAFRDRVETLFDPVDSKSFFTIKNII